LDGKDIARLGATNKNLYDESRSAYYEKKFMSPGYYSKAKVV
jgi:hypothetical protein